MWRSARSEPGGQRGRHADRRGWQARGRDRGIQTSAGLVKGRRIEMPQLPAPCRPVWRENSRSAGGGLRERPVEDQPLACALGAYLLLGYWCGDLPPCGPGRSGNLPHRQALRATIPERSRATVSVPPPLRRSRNQSYSPGRDCRRGRDRILRRLPHCPLVREPDPPGYRPPRLLDRARDSTGRRGSRRRRFSPWKRWCPWLRA
jgi:hypothetical protein